MRQLFHDGLFALSLVLATGMVMLSFSLIDVISASPPHKVTHATDTRIRLAFGGLHFHRHAHRHADRDAEIAPQIPPRE
jgi:hypothetical protein